jgi:hypothetical protein
MSRSMIRLLVPALAAAFFFAPRPAAEAQVVTTGVVMGVEPAKGIVTLRVDSTNKPMSFVNMQKAPISRASGKAAKLEDVWTGMRVSVSYAQIAGRWYVARLYIPDPPPPPASQDWIWSLTPGQRRGLYAPRSNDITKRPGNTAATDNDITTKPPRRGLFENDITLRNDNR